MAGEPSHLNASHIPVICCNIVQAALRALSASPLCPEAYHLLAITKADSYDKALELYRKGVEAGPQVGFDARRAGLWAD